MNLAKVLMQLGQQAGAQPPTSSLTHWLSCPPDDPSALSLDVRGFLPWHFSSWRGKFLRSSVKEITTPEEKELQALSYSVLSLPHLGHAWTGCQLCECPQRPWHRA